MKKILPLLLLFLSALPTFCAETADSLKIAADSAYARTDYGEAVRLYETLAKDAPNVTVYYNLGNAYYRKNESGKAILNYRRALRMDPSDEDVRYNLELCMSKTTDRFDKPSEMFFVTWTRNLIHSRNANVWGAFALFALLGTLLFVALYLFSGRLLVRKAGFTIALLCCVLTLVFHIFAYARGEKENASDEAVVIESAQVYDAPSLSSKKVRMLHEGTTIFVLDGYAKDWLQIEMPDGSRGWLSAGDVEKV